MTEKGATMSDEETSTDLHAAPSTDEEAPAGEPTLAQQLQEIRIAAIADVEESRKQFENDHLTRSAATALDAGVDIDIVAEKVGVSAGTIRNWAKSLEGGA